MGIKECFVQVKNPWVTKKQRTFFLSVFDFVMVTTKKNEPSPSLEYWVQVHGQS